MYTTVKTSFFSAACLGLIVFAAFPVALGLAGVQPLVVLWGVLGLVVLWLEGGSEGEAFGRQGNREGEDNPPKGDTAGLCWPRGSSGGAPAQGASKKTAFAITRLPAAGWKAKAWFLLVGLMGGVWVFYTAKGLWLLGLGLGWPGLVVTVALWVALALWMHRRGRWWGCVAAPHAAWWGLAAVGLVLLRTALTEVGARPLGQLMHFHPLVVGWPVAALVWHWGGRLGVRPSLHFAATANWLLFAMMMEFYNATFPLQVAAIDRQPGVTVLHREPAANLRWVAEGCGPGEYWLGLRHRPDGATLLGVKLSADAAVTKQKGWPKAFRVGQYTNENGAVDCWLNMAFTGDLGLDGVLHGAKLDTGKVRLSSRKTGDFTAGMAGLDYHPGLGWLLGARESGMVHLLRLEDGRWKQQDFNNLKATQVFFCPGRRQRCFYSVGTRRVCKVWGGQFEKRQCVVRKPFSLPQGALDAQRGRLYVTDWYGGGLQVYDTGKGVSLVKNYAVPVGVRYAAVRPSDGRVFLANTLTGWLYILNPTNGQLKRVLFVGRKSQWIKFSHDGKWLLWCAASACYRVFVGEKSMSIPKNCVWVPKKPSLK